MKKMMIIIMMFAMTLTSHAQAMTGLANVLDASSKEEFLNEFNKQFDRSQKHIAKLLKKSDKELDEMFSKYVTTLKSEHEEVLFDFDLDHVSTTREVLEVLSSDAAQLAMTQKFEVAIENAGGFDNFKAEVAAKENSQQKFVGKLFGSILRGIRSVVYFVFVYPVFVIYILLGGWS